MLCFLKCMSDFKEESAPILWGRGQDTISLTSDDVYKRSIKSMVCDWRVRGIRGATTVERNAPECIRDAVLELFHILIKENNLVPENVISATFTLTSDLNAAYSETFVREYLEGWDHVPI